MRVEDLLHVREPVVLEAPARDGEVAEPVLAGLDVAQVEPPVRREAGVQDDVAQPRLLAAVLRRRALAQREDGREAGDRLRQQRPLADDAEAAGAFGDEQVALGREGHREGVHQLGDDGFDAEVVQGRAPQRRGPGAGLPQVRGGQTLKPQMR